MLLLPGSRADDGLAQSLQHVGRFWNTMISVGDTTSRAHACFDFDPALSYEGLRDIVRAVRNVLNWLRNRAPSDVDKEQAELDYWRKRKLTEGELSKDHFERFYTTEFGLSRDWYREKRVLDIGCGPRGSLEWATMAAERIGLDPLAESYRALGADRHRMRYVCVECEIRQAAGLIAQVGLSARQVAHVARRHVPRSAD